MADVFENLPLFHYGLIMADPPWAFDVWSENGTSKSPVKHYKTMTTPEICALPVGHLASKDCALLLWCTSPRLPCALKVMEAWGFRYVTKAFAWGKRRAAATPDDRIDDPKSWHIGLGYTSRANTEDCWLGFNGNPKRLNADVRELIIAPRREHSRKPDEAFERAERLYPGPYLDLFSRQRRPGWDAWGNEVDKFEVEDA